MQNKYKYETHLHTFPVSKCASVSPRENLEFYKSIGYDGVFITNHFPDGNSYFNNDISYKKQMDFYFSDYEEAVSIGKEIDIKVFLGAELAYHGTDFLVYGPDKTWYLEHPEIMTLKQSEKLTLLRENGALVIQAHPFREADYIDHIRLFPRSVHGVEVINTCRTDFENKMAKLYAQNYKLLEFAGSDNHIGKHIKTLAGMCSDNPLLDELDFVKQVRNGEMHIFTSSDGRMMTEAIDYDGQSEEPQEA